MVTSKVNTYLQLNKLICKHDVFVVGFSGGADSVCLLNAMVALSKEYGFKVVAAHLNHGWRNESDGEQKFAEDFCKSRGIEFYTEKLPSDIPYTELAARNCRYEFFDRAGQKYAATGIFTAHTSSDQAETVLYRIIKGTGITGLAGIPDVRKDTSFPVYRPMLDISRSEVEDYCVLNQLEYVTDASNFDVKYMRNSIRHRLLPQLSEYNKEIEQAIVRLSLHASDTEYIVKSCMDSLNNRLYLSEEVLSATEFKKLSEPLARRAIYEFLNQINVEADFKKVEQVRNFIKDAIVLKSGDTHSIGQNSWIFANNKEIKIINSIRSDVIKSCLSLSGITGEYRYEELSLTVKVLQLEKPQTSDFPSAQDETIFADLSGVNFPLYLRTRKEGDRITPIGMHSSMKLKKYLINRGIPLHVRDQLPLLADSEQVLWVAGVGMSELIKVTGVPTHKIEILRD